METIQRNRMLWRISLVVVILFATFWGSWYFITGSVPATTGIKWDEKTAIQPLFTMSRAWDVLFALIWAVLLILLCSIIGTMIIDLFFGGTMGLLFGLLFILNFGLSSIFLATMTICLLIGVTVGSIAEDSIKALKRCFFGGLGAGLGIGLSAGILNGLCDGLFVGLALGVGIGSFIALSVCIGINIKTVLAILKRLFSKDFWKKSIQWFSGK